MYKPKVPHTLLIATIPLLFLACATPTGGQNEETTNTPPPKAPAPPPKPDTDGDTIPDDLDKCPEVAEDKDAFEDEDGCPDNDNDKDTVPDADDKCPNQAGATLFAGCTMGDQDGDIALDHVDVCPQTKGTLANQGCPEPSRLGLTHDRIHLLEPVYFDTAKARIRPQTYALLDEIATLLGRHPTLHVRIENHRDSIPERQYYGMRLTDKRAKSVREYLIRKGIDPARMVSVGYGEERPIADNKTKEGRAMNRRTEFHIVSRDGVTLRAKSGGTPRDARSPDDRDGDGLNNDHDGCPDKAGRLEREGCPLP